MFLCYVSRVRLTITINNNAYSVFCANQLGCSERIFESRDALGIRKSNSSCIGPHYSARYAARCDIHAIETRPVTGDITVSLSWSDCCPRHTRFNLKSSEQRLSVESSAFTFFRRDDARTSVRSGTVAAADEELISTWHVANGRLAMAAISWMCLCITTVERQQIQRLRTSRESIYLRSHFRFSFPRSLVTSF